MAEEESIRDNTSTLESELYFLIAKFLGNGPCKEATDVLRREIEQHGLFSTRFDWKGNKHQQSFKNLDEHNGHIQGTHLLQMVSRIGGLLDRDVKPRVQGVKSLLGGARQSLLRKSEDVKPPLWSPSVHAALVNHRPLAPPNKLAHVPNMYNVVQGRRLSGMFRLDHMIPGERYGDTRLHLRTLGHLSSVYCVLFDQTGRRIFTGADDHLVKIWGVDDGRLLATLRGHAAEIVDMNVNYENTLLAAASNDKVIRVWNLQTLAPVAVLMGHSAMLTSLEFSPYCRGSTRYMATTGADGCVCMWVWDKNTLQFNNKPIKFQERNRPGSQMLCLSFSPGGTFLVAGCTDTIIRVYNFNTTPPEKVKELEAHTDRVDSITFCHSGSRFISGSKDGSARVWRYERQEWKNILLNMSTRLPGSKTPGLDEGNKILKHRVTMVGWDKNDRYVITAVNDLSLRVWNSYTGKLVYELYGHTDEVYVLEGHPKDARIFLSGGHDGLIFLWDLTTGRQLYRFLNTIEGQGFGSIYDCKFSPTGDHFVATDSHGHLSIFGQGSGKLYDRVPTEQFFHTDYRPLVRDANNYVLDEQTQQAPHLMPPPFLVDIDGNPHPPVYQRLVPGRENCRDSALIPQIGVAENGNNEVIGEGEVEEEVREPEPLNEENEANQAASLLDELIHRMQQDQDGERGEGSQERPLTPGRDRGANGPLSPGGPMSPRGLRRVGEIEGVRQATGNVPISQRASQAELLAFKTRVVVPELPSSIARFQEELRRMLDEEARKIRVERKKRQVLPPVEGSESSDSKERLRRRRKPKSKLSHKYGTRANQDGTPLIDASQLEEERRRKRHRIVDDDDAEGDDLSDMDEVDEGAMSGAETSEEENEWHSTSEHESESSEYSDWTADAGINLQPPKKKSQTKKRRLPWESDGDTSASPQKTPSNTPVKSKRKRRPPKTLIEDMEIDDDSGQIGELPEEMKPPRWITDPIPRRCPYVPQMGDEVMYFRQGHEAYVNAVKKRKVYHIEPKKQHWTKINLKDHELVRITGIKYQVGPPTLCGLKLAFTDPETRKPTGGSFSIKYHDMPDVIDFLVLRQHYDQAVARKWKPGDRFRSMIDDAWWLGSIVAHNPLESDHPDSLFQCYLVDWDNGECERMSPWDLEPIDEDNLPDSKGGSIPVTDDELLSMLYIPEEGEWGDVDRDTYCDRLMKCLEQVMSLRIAEQFNTPVDLSRYPSYAYMVPYPTDLSTIMRRIERRFYRRVTALQWEVRKIEQNAMEFNERDSIIVLWAEQLVKILLEAIKDDHCDDAMEIYNRITKDSDMEVNIDDSDHDKNGRSNRNKGKKGSPSKKQKRKPKSCYNSKAWLEECKQLLRIMWDSQDSEPFRVPVDEALYPEYRTIIDHPMDLTTLKQQLAIGSYRDPMDLGRDIRLMFTNAKSFTPNKKSRIYGMTLRLSAHFEEHFLKILSSYKSAVKYEKQVKTGLKRRKQLMSSPEARRISPSKHRLRRVKRSLTTSATPKSRDGEDTSDVEAPGPSGIQRRLAKSTKRRRKEEEEEEEDDDSDTEEEEEDERDRPGPSGSHGNRVESSKMAAHRVNGIVSEDDDTDEDEEEKAPVRERLKAMAASQMESKTRTKGSKAKIKKAPKKVVIKEEEEEEEEEDEDTEVEDDEETEIEDNGEEEEEEEEEEKEEKSEEVGDDEKEESEEDDEEEEEEDDDEEEEEEEDEEEEEEEEEQGKRRLRTRRPMTNGYGGNHHPKRKRKTSDDSEESDSEEEEKEEHEEEEEEEEEEKGGGESEDSNFEVDTDINSNDESESSTEESESSDSDSDDGYTRTRTRSKSKTRTRGSKKLKKSSRGKRKMKIGKKRKAKSKRSSRSSPKKRSKKEVYSDDDNYVPSHRDQIRTERTTRNQGRQLQYYGDYDEESDNQSGDDDAAKSVSSRGRVRTLTPRARASLLGE